MEKRYLDERGLADVATHVNTRLKTVTTIPVSADNGAVRLYVGTTTNTYTNGHIYQYDLTNTTWKDITNFSIIFTGTRTEWNNLSLVEKQAYDICNITDDNESGSVGGGDMDSSVYDPNSTVANAGGIVDYVEDKFSNIVANEFDSTETYAKDDYCMYNGLLYKFNKSHTGAWSSSDADEVLVSEEFGTGGNTDYVELTQAQYDLLTTAEKNNGTLYFITDAEGGGGSVIDGSTVTPTNDIQTWLECANLRQNYTALNEVLADNDVLEALISNTNAVDYMVRSTTWANTICADETAMNLIGNNNYCANILLDNSTWGTAICGSAYFESVLNVKVPKMTSNTTPYGVVSSKSFYDIDREPWKAFDGDDTTYFYGTADDTNQYLKYDFVSPVVAKKFSIYLKQGASTPAATWKVQKSLDGTTWTDIGTFNTPAKSTSGDIEFRTTIELNNDDETTKYRLFNPIAWLSAGNYNFKIISVQFYGRADKGEVSGITKTIAIHSAAVDTVTFTDASGIKSVTTDANGYATATITYISGQVITFTSSVAKNPDNLSENYKKSVQILEDTTEIYVMPNENTLYWWGYINNLESLTYARWGEEGYVAPTYNTNNIYLNGQCGVGVTNVVSPTAVHGVCKTTQKYNDIGIQYFGFTTRYWAEGTSCFSVRQNTLDTIEHIQTSATGQACYPLMRTPSAVDTGSSGYIYAIWYEVAGEDLDDKADTTLIAPIQTTLTASKAYAVGEQFVYNQVLYKVTQAIASGAQITIGTNAVLAGSVTEQLYNIPSIDAMTPLVNFTNRLSDISGGYIQTGKTVYVKITAKIATAFQTTVAFPFANNFSILSGLPKQKYNNIPLGIVLRSIGNNNRIILGISSSVMIVDDGQGNENSQITLNTSTSYSPAVGDNVTIQGSYEAL